MKNYKIDISISETVGKCVRDTVYTVVPKSTEEEAIHYAICSMKLRHNLFGDNINWFIHKIEEVA